MSKRPSLPDFSFRFEPHTARELERLQKVYHETHFAIAQERFRYICQFINNKNIVNISTNHDNIKKVEELKELGDETADFALKLFKIQYFI
ncbi:hypothetical protein Hokovirus_3_6 [Hokovirus HKV1]|uniref:Uncharacterized protein n=1 Tax=Hokovirus HKV1 TaxID=1977638 RepID=A0A1V0SG98_9VIRU|nr:hypothetical protein Hokovirus_3_6 [Hokovirus HKV1]